MGQDISSDRPAQPLGVRADLAAWGAALRGLRDNPLLTHLMKAKRRRYRSLPFYRRWLLPAAALLITGLVTPMFVENTVGSFGRYYIIGMALPCLTWFVLSWYGLWLVQGVFEAVMGAAGMLGRHVKRSGYLVLDDFTALSRMNDHELTAGAVAAFLPPLAWRVIAGVLLFACTPLWLFLDGQLQWFHQYSDGSMYYIPSEYNTDYYHEGMNITSSDIINSIVHYLGISITAVLLGTAAAVLLLLWYLALGRSLNTARLGVLAAAGAVLAQLAYPMLYYISFDPYSTEFEWLDLATGRGSCFALLFLAGLTPGLAALLLGLARRIPWARVTLLLAGPIIFTAALFTIPLLFWSVADTATDGLGTEFLFAPLPGAVSVATGGFALLAPLAVAFNDLNNDGWYNLEEQPIAFTYFATLTLLTQALLIYIASRFAIEAVGARRRRGE